MFNSLCSSVHPREAPKARLLTAAARVVVQVLSQVYLTGMLLFCRWSKDKRCARELA